MIEFFTTHICSMSLPEFIFAVLLVMLITVLGILGKDDFRGWSGRKITLLFCCIIPLWIIFHWVHLIGIDWTGGYGFGGGGDEMNVASINAWGEGYSDKGEEVPQWIPVGFGMPRVGSLTYSAEYYPIAWFFHAMNNYGRNDPKELIYIPRTLKSVLGWSFRSFGIFLGYLIIFLPIAYFLDWQDRMDELREKRHG